MLCLAKFQTSFRMGFSHRVSNSPGLWPHGWDCGKYDPWRKACLSSFLDTTIKVFRIAMESLTGKGRLPLAQAWVSTREHGYSGVLGRHHEELETAPHLKGWTSMWALGVTGTGNP